jgi:shikimate dehydrogenase
MKLVIISRQKDDLRALACRFLLGAEAEISIRSEEELRGILERREFDLLLTENRPISSLAGSGDALSLLAGETSSADTLICQKGQLTAYNCGYQGFLRYLKEEEQTIKGKYCLLTGPQAMVRTASQVISDLGGKLVSDDETECNMLIRTGQSDADRELACLNDKRLNGLEKVIDLVCNPLRSSLLFEAKTRGIQTAGGLKYQVYTLIHALQLAGLPEVSEEKTVSCLRHILNRKANMVIIGMPTAGKTTVGKLIRERYGREIIETDDLIRERIGMSISDYFSLYGEQAFRQLESEICQQLREGNGSVISTGGGVVNRRENMEALAANSLIVWLDRDLDLLQSSDSRPLTRNRQDLERIYRQRRQLYEMYGDIRVENNMTLDDVMNKLEEYL